MLGYPISDVSTLILYSRGHEIMLFLIKDPDIFIITRA